MWLQFVFRHEFTFIISPVNAAGEPRFVITRAKHACLFDESTEGCREGMLVEKFINAVN